MEITETKKKNLRGLLIKKPFYRLLPNTPDKRDFGVLRNTNEKVVLIDNLAYVEVTQADFRRELDPASHAINDPTVYINYRYNKEDGLVYEEDFPRYAFAYQQEILDDRMARTTGNDIQFDLADDITDEKKNEAYNKFKAGWADKRMENAWHFSIKSDYATGDTAFVGILDKGKFRWKVLSYLNGDVLYPHYDRISGRLNLFARTYSADDDEGVQRNYVDVWDDKHYYRLVNDDPNKTNVEENAEIKTPSLETLAGDFNCEGYVLEEQKAHGFKEIPVAYHRREDGPVWSPSQETIEHREAAFSRLAQSNHDFGLPIMFLKGKGKQIKEIATSDMSYASKIFIIPENGEAGFLNRQDASNAYKTELDMLEDKIYSQSMVVKAPELKSGDTPAAAIKLLYSDAYNKALLEIQEYDEFVCKMIEIFKFGYGVESENRLAFINTRISFYVTPFIPINDQEVTTNLATAVQNGFVSKQTASEKFYFATPQEWKRIQAEKKAEQQQELLLQEQKLEIQTDAQIEVAEKEAEINTEQQIDTIKAEQQIENGENPKKKIRTRKGSVATGNGVKRGRPATSGKQWDEWGNEIDPTTGKAKSKWDK
jgi:hypothetical protein